MLKLIYTFDHAVNSRCYGRCYVSKLEPLCTFLKFHTYLEVNSARLLPVLTKERGGSNIGFVHPASHHLFLLHPAIPPNETFPSRSRLLVLVNMQLM